MLRKELAELESEVEKETRIRHIVSRDRLKATQEIYYAFVQDEKQFQGELLQIEDFNKLTLEAYQVINIYDQERNLRPSTQGKKKASRIMP